MEWERHRVEIESADFRIRMIEPSDFDAIAAALQGSDCFFARYHGLDSADKILAMLANNHTGYLAGACLPVLVTVANEIAGITRFHRLNKHRRSVEIGATWIVPKWRRTFVNTQTKRLMMREAFEVMEAERVEFVVHESNFVSQVAVLRLGAQREGTMRRTLVKPEGQGANSHLYSVIRPDWFGVERRLEALAGRQEAKEPYLPAVVTGQRVRLKRYALNDAQALLDLVGRNRSGLQPSFPKMSALEGLSESLAWIAQTAHQSAQGTACWWGVWAGNGHKSLIGHVHAKELDWKTKVADLGYFIDVECQRQGYGAETVRLISEELLGPQKFSRLVLRILPQNTASLGLAEKLGFEKEGVMRNAFIDGTGKLRDVVLYAKCPDPSMA